MSLNVINRQSISIKLTLKLVKINSLWFVYFLYSLIAMLIWKVHSMTYEYNNIIRNLLYTKSYIYVIS